MGRYFFHDEQQQQQQQQNYRFCPTSTSSENVRHDNQHDKDNDESHEEGEIIEDDDDQNDDNDELPVTEATRASYLPFARLWRHSPQQSQAEQPNYALFASSEYNNVSDNDDDDQQIFQNEEERDEDGAINTFRNHQTDLSRIHTNTASELQKQQQPIHYHIYIPESEAARWHAVQDRSTATPQRSRLPWRFITLLAFITHILYWYGPSIPPTLSSSTATTTWNQPQQQYPLDSLESTTISWSDYWIQQQQLIRHVSTEWFSLIYHVTYWSLHGLRQDWQQWWTIWVMGKPMKGGDSSPQPNWVFPTRWNLRKKSGTTRTTVTSQHRILVFGQDAAMECVETSLNAWRQSDGPVLFYLTGGKAVGKRSVAYMLLQQMLPPLNRMISPSIEEDCSEEFSAFLSETTISVASEKSVASSSCPLLRLTPDDFRDIHGAEIDEYNGHRYATPLSTMVYERIVDHALRQQTPTDGYGGASILLLQRVDEYPPDVLLEVVKNLQSHPAIFRSTIVIMTSHVGTATLHKWMRKHLQQQQQQWQDYSLGRISAEGQTMLRFEIQQYHNDSTKDWIIVPMISLDAAAMMDILTHIITGGRGSRPYFAQQTSNDIVDPQSLSSSLHFPFEVTPSAADHILDSLEWHQWIHKTTGDTLRSWSPDGAHPLLQLWDELVVKSISCFQVYDPGCSTASFPRMERYANDGINFYIVMDSVDHGLERFVLKVCMSMENWDLERGDTADLERVSTIQGHSLACMQEQPSCQFYL